MTLFTARRVSLLSSLRIGHLQSLTGKFGYSKNCSDILKGNVIVRRHCVVQKMGAGRGGVLLCSVAWPNSQKLVLCLAPVCR